MEFDPGSLANIVVAVVVALAGGKGVNFLYNRYNGRNDISSNDASSSNNKNNQHNSCMFEDKIGAMTTSITELKLMIAELDGNMKVRLERVERNAIENLGDKFSKHVKDYH